MKTTITQRKIILPLATLAVIVCTSLVFQLTQNFYMDLIVGEKYYKDGQYDKALPYFLEAYSGAPQNIKAAVYLLWTYQRLGLKEESNELLKEIWQYNPQDTKIMIQLADGLYGISNYSGAEELYRAALRIQGSANVKRKLAEVLVPQKKYGEAIVLFNELALENPEDLELKEYLADIYSWNGNYNEAVELYKKIYELSPAKDPALLKKTADVLKWSKRNEEAAVYYKKYLQEE